MDPGSSKEEIRARFEKRLKGTFNELVGLEILDAGHGFAKLRLAVRPELLQPAGVLHGGAVCTLVDVTGGVAAHLSCPGADMVTVEMKVNFIAGVSEGALLSESSPLHIGRRTSVWQIRVNEETSGRTVAFGTATYMMVKEPGA